MELTSEHVAPYYPFKVGVTIPEEQEFSYYISLLSWGGVVIGCEEAEEDKFYGFDEGIKLILRPLSDITKEIEHNGERFVTSDRTQVGMEHGRVYSSIGIVENRITTNAITYSDMAYLISLHFDVFDLIAQDLAIDINTI